MNLNWKNPMVVAGAAAIFVIIVIGIWFIAAHGTPPSAGPAAAASSSTSPAASSTSGGGATATGSGSAVAKSSPKTAPSSASRGSAFAGPEVVQPSEASGPVLDPASFAVNTGNWITCRNTAYGYEIKYPAAWMAFTYEGDHWAQIARPDCASGSELIFSANDPLVERIRIAVYPADATDTLPALNTSAAQPGLSWQETTIGGEPALWNDVIDVAANVRTDTVNVRHGGNLYVIEYWFCTATSYVNENEVYFQTMAENLKFL